VDSLTPADLQAAAKKYFVDNSLIVTTLAKDPLPAAIQTLPSLDAMTPAAAAAPAGRPTRPRLAPVPRGDRSRGPVRTSRSSSSRPPLPQLEVKLPVRRRFGARPPPGKKGSPR